ncbi:MAG: hypothetical protein HY392_04690 [Candidatus Diapherotrites archaeon]|nr:hypothetical protein [Candidatus Diapherotrites archaeon]
MKKSIQSGRKTYGITGIIFAVVFLAAVFPLGVAAQDLGFLAEITSTSILPSVIHAGDVISIAVDVHNRGSVIAIRDLNAYIETSPQFEPLNAQANVDLISQGDTKTLSFKIRAKEDTEPGYYAAIINLEYLRQGEMVSQKEAITITVAQAANNIDVTVSPRIVNPGKETEIRFVLENVGKSAVSNVSFSWSEEDDFILPLGTDNRRYVDVVWPGESETVSYTIAADPNISPGIYPLDVSLSFNDANGTRIQESTVGLIIGGGTDFEVSAERLSTGQISLSIANIGSNNAESVVVKVPRAPDAGIFSSYTEILGNLNKGDFTIAAIETRPAQSVSQSTAAPVAGQGFGGQRVFQRSPQNTEQNANVNASQAIGASEITVLIEYTDTTGQRQSVSKNVEVISQATGFLGTNATTQPEGGNMALLAFVFAVIAGAAIAYNRFWAGKKWASLAKIIGASAFFFLAAIFAFQSGIPAIAAAGILSIALLAWFFLRAK